MLRNRRYFVVFFIAVWATGLYIYNQLVYSVVKLEIEPPRAFENSISAKKYQRDCVILFKKLRYPNSKLVFRPPLRSPPAEMLNDFEQNGDMPIETFYYFDNAYSDSNKMRVANEGIGEPIITKELVDTWRKKVKNRQRLVYKDQLLRDLILDNSNLFKNKRSIVIGTIEPWAEAIALEAGAANITTLDYTRKRYEQSNMEWIHVNDYLDLLIGSSDGSRRREIAEYDLAVSFSSIEHSGLGRYGDPLSPNGDIDAIRQIHCLLKMGGLLFLGIPTSYSGKSYIEFNAHRVYGYKRLELLFQGWRVIFQHRSNDLVHSVFVLQKIPFT